MRISENGLNFIKSNEGLRLKPYLCPAKIPTIGYGSTFYLDGTKVTLNDKSITEDEATDMLEALIEKEFDIAPLLKVKVTQNQFDALTDFVYNIGMPRFRTSTLLKYVNQGEFLRASAEFILWNKPKEILGRRERERNLFLKA